MISSLVVGAFQILRLLVLLPHILALATSSSRSVIAQDVERWAAIKGLQSSSRKQAARYPLYRHFITLMNQYPEFRSLFYYRIWNERPLLVCVLRCLYRPMSNLYIDTPVVGPGLYIQHGFSTVITAKSIGSNCWINQQVTIGFSPHEGCPTIEDNVQILAGAKVVGDITLGRDSTVGANCVVVKDVPEHCTVVGIPAHIVKRNGQHSMESL